MKNLSSAYCCVSIFFEKLRNGCKISTISSPIVSLMIKLTSRIMSWQIYEENSPIRSIFVVSGLRPVNVDVRLGEQRGRTSYAFSNSRLFEAKASKFGVYIGGCLNMSELESSYTPRFGRMSSATKKRIFFWLLPKDTMLIITKVKCVQLILLCFYSYHHTSRLLLIKILSDLLIYLWGNTQKCFKYQLFSNCVLFVFSL